MKGILDYVPGSSFLHRLNPLVKLLLAFVLCASCFVTGNHFIVLGVIALNLALAFSAGIFGRALKMLSSLLKLSALLFLVQIFFVREGQILLQLPLGLYITDLGLSFSLLFVLRLLAAALPLGLMLSVTQTSDIPNVLVRKLGLPYQYAFVLGTAIRFIPLFAQEMAGIMEAQTARGVEFDTKNFFKKVALLLPLCAPLLVSSVRRIEGGAISAELRGFYLRGRKSGYKDYPFALRDFGALLGGACVLALAVLF
ncbi:MAG: energy-coupling factor transporter transmembrane protein EcfT [Christensenellaceae bacterium]|nr:energy-coupling factor transporter transmembrane protein EcfT [Christensenellaceae bacterium]